MANVTPPKYVRQILFSLQSRGFAAYLVGGCVRDILLGVRPQDWDICTSALPEQVLDIFPGSRPTGIKHGTVTVVIGSRSAEVTTFRSEGDYTDHRHPSSVAFVGNLTTDLMRRDFTMNAMAVSADGLIIDPYGGAEDIRRGCIRCVGAPEKRFDEDALRMLRAFRFSSRLGFEIEPATLAAIGKKAPLAAGLAAERVSTEVEKILLTARPETLNTVISLGLIDKYLDRRIAPEEEQLHRIAALPKKALERWAALCRLLTAAGAIRSAEQFLTALRLDSRSIRCCNDACEMLESPAPGSPLEWKKLLRQYGVDSVSCAARCHDALCGGSSCRALKAVIKAASAFQ
ncbi:MAG: tRNA nucleotidyltransferase [Oscillospiraceae bacterium]